MDRDNDLSMQQIEAIRKARGTAARVARTLNVHPSTVSRVLSGQRTGGYGKRTARVLDALRTEARRLLGEQE